MRKIFILLLTTSLLAAGCQKSQVNNSSEVSSPTPSPSATPVVSPTASVTPTPTTQNQSKLTQPISNALSRITKKPFGIHITPQNSPVSPEVFSGYHTATDFETTDDEQNSEVAVYAACDGKLLQKRTVTGYGGLVVQSCKIDGLDLTVLYGHVKLSSVSKSVGTALKAGEQIAILGQGYTAETSNERKHLHFGIHKGTSIVLLGYVQKQAELSGWLNPEDYLE